MRQTIHSKWHKIADVRGAQVAIETNDAKISERNVRRATDVDAITTIFDHMNSLPKYVIYEDVADIVFDKNSQIQKSIRALRQADLAHLPFEEVVVEYDRIKWISGALIRGDSIDAEIKCREFVWLLETKIHKFFQNDTHDPFIAVPFTMIEPPGHTKPLLILNTNCLTGNFIESDDKLGVSYRSFTTPFLNMKYLSKLEQQILQKAGQYNAMEISATALAAVVALLHTKGVTLEQIDAPVKLNKSRVASGKAPIQRHTVIRIGHVYDRSGNKVEYGSSGRKMPVHWRAGHLRNQRYGTGLEKVREVFIKPMLINYEEGNDVPIPMKEVTI